MSANPLAAPAPEAAAHSVDTFCLLNRLAFCVTGRASAWRVQAAPAAAVVPGDNVALVTFTKACFEAKKLDSKIKIAKRSEKAPNIEKNENVKNKGKT